MTGINGGREPATRGALAAFCEDVEMYMLTKRRAIGSQGGLNWTWPRQPPFKNAESVVWHEVVRPPPSLSLIYRFKQ
jgi:hypothetical protein